MTHTGQTGIFFDSGGFKLLGTFFMAPGNAPKPTAILLHGIPGIEKNYDLALKLRDNGWNALIFHYRGSWGSEGAYRVSTIPDDVIAAVDYLSSGAHPVVDPQKIVLIGHSLGGWAAVLASARDRRVRGVAALASVSDPHRWGMSVESAEGFTPWLQEITPQGLAEQWADLTLFQSPLDRVKQIAPRPLLIIHGAKDAVIPKKFSEELFENAGNPKKLIIQEDSNHSFTWHRPWLLDQILEWLEQFK